jgi:hypothetical protein
MTAQANDRMGSCRIKPPFDERALERKNGTDEVGRSGVGFLATA